MTEDKEEVYAFGPPATCPTIFVHIGFPIAVTRISSVVMLEDSALWILGLVKVSVDRGTLAEAWTKMEQ